MAAVHLQGQRQQTLQECLLACEKCNADEQKKRAAFKIAERRELGNSGFARPSFFRTQVSSSKYMAESGTGSGSIQAPSSSPHRKNAVEPESALHALVQMGGKEGITKMPSPGSANMEESPLLFDPSMRVILRDTVASLLVVALKAIVYSAIGVGLVYAISFAATESELESESVPFSAATDENAGGNFTFLGNSTFLGNFTLATEGGPSPTDTTTV
jgi:hypothetical protein